MVTRRHKGLIDSATRLGGGCRTIVRRSHDGMFCHGEAGVQCPGRWETVRTALRRAKAGELRRITVCARDRVPQANRSRVHPARGTEP